MKRFIVLHGARGGSSYYIQVSQIRVFGTAEECESTDPERNMVSFHNERFFCKETIEEIMTLIEAD